jgi:hypothetical protein
MIAEGHLQEHRKALAQRLRSVGIHPPEPCDGRGIIVCAGGSRMFTNAYVLVWVLRRHLLSTLPIEVWHLGGDEMSAAMAALLEQLGARVIDAMQRLRTHPASVRDGWQLKAYALVATHLREVLLLDADQVPTRDPLEVFSWPEYQASGAVFWPDIVDLARDNPIWELCGVEAGQRVSFESGQAVIDRQRHWQPLNAALYLNEHADVFYRLVYGDKDTFLAAWLFTGAAHALVPHRPYVDERCLFQRDFAGAPLFQHRTGAKWEYSGAQQAIAGFVHFDTCLTALAELQQSWAGRVFRAPRRSLKAGRAESEIVAQGAFALRRSSEPDQPIRLGAHGEVTAGRSLFAQNWFVREQGDLLELVLYDGSRETCRLRPMGGGVWTGTGTGILRGAVHLIPADGGGEGQRRPSSGASLLADILRAELSASPFDDDMARRLETTFTVLARAEPALAEDLGRCAEAAGEGTAIRSFLAALAARLRSELPSPGEPVRRSDEAMLFDPLHYVWP